MRKWEGERRRFVVVRGGGVSGWDRGLGTIGGQWERGGEGFFFVS